MGCDIHAHVEVKINGEWHHYNHPRIDRWYDLFARMAGVRNHKGTIEPISEPRGVPEDATFITKFDMDNWGADAHSHSWLSSEEVARLGNWAESKMKELAPNVYYSFEMHDVGYIFGCGWDYKKYSDSTPSVVQDSRLIFWFDN